MTELARINLPDGMLVIGSADSDRTAINEEVGTRFRGPTGSEWIKTGTAIGGWIQVISVGAQNVLNAVNTDSLVLPEISGTPDSKTLFIADGSDVMIMYAFVVNAGDDLTAASILNDGEGIQYMNPDESLTIVSSADIDQIHIVGIDSSSGGSSGTNSISYDEADEDDVLAALVKLDFTPTPGVRVAQLIPSARFATDLNQLITCIGGTA